MKRISIPIQVLFTDPHINDEESPLWDYVLTSSNTELEWDLLTKYITFDFLSSGDFLCYSDALIV